jgi:hypothetical protein
MALHTAKEKKKIIDFDLFLKFFDYKSLTPPPSPSPTKPVPFFFV